MHQTSTGTTKKKTKLPATTQKWTHSSWNCCSFFWFVWYLCRFGASSGLFFFVFLVPVQVWWLWLHKTLTGTNTTRCTKHRQAPKKKIQQLLRSAPIVPGFFLFFLRLCRFGASSGLFFVFFGCLCRFGDSDFTTHWQAAQTIKKHS